MQIRSVRDAEIKGKRVVMRVDFNVPLKEGVVVDDARIKAVVPTLEFLQQAGAAQITLLTHLGRPEGSVVESLKVAPVEVRLRELTQVPFELKENLRFDSREEANDEGFAKELAGLGDIFVNDAFAVAHRAAASTVGITKYLPSFAGLLVEREVAMLSEALEPPPNSLAILGGAKFETKIPLIETLLKRYGRVLLGGALGNDVVKARGLSVGSSLVSAIPVPTELAMNERLMVPLDAVVRDKDLNAERTALIHDLRAIESVVDIGPATEKLWQEEVEQAPFVLWNGPLGVYESGYTRGTNAVAEALTRAKVRAVVGGGDTIAAVSHFTFDPEKVFLSTGGGAMLEFLAQGTLPALEPLKK